MSTCPTFFTRTLTSLITTAAIACGPLLAQNQGLDWSRIMGGVGDDYAWFPNALSVAANDEPVLCGRTMSHDFPKTNSSSYQGGGADAFLSRLSADGSQLLYSTFLGGTGEEQATAVYHDDATGLTYVAGVTLSTDFPTTGTAVQSVNNGAADAFLSVFDTATDTLVYSTLLGGSGNDMFAAIHVDIAQRVVLVGATQSTDFPTTAHAFSTLGVGGDEVVVVEIDLQQAGAAGLVYASYFGGSGDDSAQHCMVDGNGVLTVTGTTTPPTGVPLPTTANAYRPSYMGGPRDAFVARFDRSLGGAASLIYATHVGGNADDNANAATLASDGTVFVGGWTWSSNLGTTANAVQPASTGGADAYVLRIDPSQPGNAALVYGTYLGGTGDDGVNGMCVDSADRVVLTGYAASTDLPVTPGAHQSVRHSLGADAFVARIDTHSGRLLYSSYLGGFTNGGGIWNGWSVGYEVQPDRNGGVVMVGMSDSTTFPATYGSHAGGRDAIVARFNLHPDGVARYGDSSPNCGGRLFAGVTSMPSSGNAAFALTCVGAEPTGFGAIGVAFAPDPGTPILGCTVWILPTSPIVLATFADASGYAEVPLPLTGVPPGLTIYCQSVWPNGSPASCGGALLSATNALRVTVQ